MRKLPILILMLMLIVLPTSASMINMPVADVQAGMVIAPIGGGASPTYDLAWTGEHASGIDYFSDDHQADTNTMTGTGSTYADGTGNGAQLAAPNDNIEYDGYNASAADTVWFRINMTQPTATRGNEAQFFEWYGDADNYVSVRVDDGDDSIKIRFEDTASVTNFDSSTETFTEDSFVYVGISWDMANDDMAVVVGSSSWADGDENTSFGFGATSWGVTPTAFRIGEALGGSNITANEELWIDNVYHIAGYKEAWPGS